MDTAPPLFVGTSNRVYAIERASGRVLWNVTLNRKFFKWGSSFVSLEFDGTLLLAAVCGELYGLDPDNGEVLWKIPLKGALYNPVTFAGNPSSNAMAAALVKLRRDRATNTSVP